MNELERQRDLNQNLLKRIVELESSQKVQDENFNRILNTLKRSGNILDKLIDNDVQLTHILESIKDRL